MHPWLRVRVMMVCGGGCVLLSRTARAMGSMVWMEGMSVELVV